MKTQVAIPLSGLIAVVAQSLAGTIEDRFGFADEHRRGELEQRLIKVIARHLEQVAIDHLAGANAEPVEPALGLQ